MECKYIVTTSIYPPSEALYKFSLLEDWKLIVVGDKKTPHDMYRKINCIYIHPDEQYKKYPKLSDAIGWNCIMRRNFGFIEAYNRGADIIATIDDDNFPYPEWGNNLMINKECEVDLYKAYKVFDPLHVTNHPNIWHRGFPIELLPHRKSEYIGRRKVKVKIQVDLWDGDPDIDAMCRLVIRPTALKLNITSPYMSYEVAPFDSQNTFISREIIPHYMVLPHVGRADDIWGGYIVQNMLNIRPVFFPASVYQKRNEQNLYVNLAHEILSYEFSLKMIESGTNIIDKLPEKAKIAYDAYVEAYG